MKTIEIAEKALRRGQRWLQSAQRGLEDGRWDDSVYAAQMCSEHAAKAVLIALGIEYPRRHDVSEVFATLKERNGLPSEFLTKVGELVEILAELASERALAGYGFNEGVDLDYFRDYAPEAVQKANNVLESCTKLIRGLFDTSAP